MKFKLYRPLNSFVISIETDIGNKLFLLDTGCPISFAQHAKQCDMGAWFVSEPLLFSSPPFSLTPLSERLGIPIEGFIGLRDLLKQQRVFFDFDRNYLYLGDSAQETRLSLDQKSEMVFSMELTSVRGLPLGILTSLDDPLTSDKQPTEVFFIDTGSRFIMTRDHQKDQSVNSSQSIYTLDLLTPMGNWRAQVSAEHHIYHQDLMIDHLCIAKEIPKTIPMILGTEWLSTHNAYFVFSEHRLDLITRSSKQRPVWEHLTKDLKAPLMELLFDPYEYDQNERTFTVMPRAGHRLPTGIMPMTRYRLKGLDVRADVDSVNQVLSEIMLNSNDIESVTLIDEESQEIIVPLVAIFNEPI